MMALTNEWPTSPSSALHIGLVQSTPVMFNITFHVGYKGVIGKHQMASSHYSDETSFLKHLSEGLHQSPSGHLNLYKITLIYMLADF